MDQGREEVLRPEEAAPKVRWKDRKYKGKRRKRGRPKKAKSYKRDPKRNKPRSREYLLSIAHLPPQRVGIPKGMRGDEAAELWRQAREKANYLMAKLEEAEVISFDPNVTEDQMARDALREAFAMAMSPMSQDRKLAAIRTVLEWTKAKPATKTDLKLSTAEKWLDEVVIDHQRSLAPPSQEALVTGLPILGETLRTDQD